MRRDLEKMAADTHDVIIIGGGINGTAAARDASLRGLCVALVEKHDFGWGTTSRSTRLIHGGLRYLELFDFALVREALREREILLKQAPHLVKPLPFLTPVYRRTRRGPLAVRAGMHLYDLLSYDKSLPSHRWLHPSEISAMEPHLDSAGLLGGALYYDAQVAFPERLCIEHACEADAHGALLANYAEVTAVTRTPGEVWHGPDSCRNRRRRQDGPGGVHHYRVTVRDLLSGKSYTLRAPVVVNATGPWADAIPGPTGSEGASGRLRKTKGVHIIVPAFVDHAVVLIAARDGRVFFAIPWRECSLIGTTDTDYKGDPGEAQATPEDVAYLIEETRRVFPRIDLQPIYLSMAGVRPLVRKRPATSASQVSRKHSIVDSKPRERWGIVSILGGKITNHRVVAEEAVDVVCRKLQVKRGSRTADLPLYGGDVGELDKSVSKWEEMYTSLPLQRGAVRYLAHLYGSRTPDILSLCERDRTLCQPLIYGRPEIAAQVGYAVMHEMCVHTGDFMLRRSGMGLLPQGLESASNVRSLLQKQLGWTPGDVARDHETTEPEMSLLTLPNIQRSRS